MFKASKGNVSDNERKISLEISYLSKRSRLKTKITRKPGAMVANKAQEYRNTCLDSRLLISASRPIDC